MRGGKRKGSGQPKSPTKQMRVPLPVVPAVTKIIKKFRGGKSTRKQKDN